MPVIRGCRRPQGLLPLLVALLGRADLELLVLATTFLRKLSIYAENKQRMAEAGLVARLAALMPAGKHGAVGRTVGNWVFEHVGSPRWVLGRLQCGHGALAPQAADQA